MISTNLERLQASNERINTNIVNAYIKAEEKEATLPDVQNSENLAETIENIPQSASGWQPQDDWWDVDKILAEDTEDYPSKMIILLNDGIEPMTFKITSATKIAKIKTSDGAEYTEAATHTWDRTKDKTCGLGYKTRYFIVYFNSTEASFSPDTFNMNRVRSYSYLYVIMKNLTITCNTSINGHWLSGNDLLERIKTDNSLILLNGGWGFVGNKSLIELPNFGFTGNTYGKQCTFDGCYSLKSADLSQCTITGSGENFFNNCHSLEVLKLFDTSNITSFRNFLTNNYKLKYINKIDFSSATDILYIISNCYLLVEIGEISNIKKGLDFSFCRMLNHDTLVRILNALYDYSSDTETTHTIKFGPANLAKLTDEELAIGQNKGWTIS